MTESKQTYDFLIKLLVLGDSGVGKSCFLRQYIDGQFSEAFISTVGVDFKEKRMTFEKQTGGSCRLYVQLWDTAGQERFRSLTTAFFRDAMGYIIFFDITNEVSFVHVRDWLQQLQATSDSAHQHVILCGNKTDLDAARQVETEKAQQVAEHYNMEYFETSAADGTNVAKAIDCLIDKVMANPDDITKRYNRLYFSNGKAGCEIDELSQSDGSSRCSC